MFMKVRGKVKGYPHFYFSTFVFEFAESSRQWWLMGILLPLRASHLSGHF
jgi:hypothetical protein